MAKISYGAGTIFKRGEIWYVSFWVDGRQVQQSSGSRRRQDAVLLRDQLIGKKSRGEVADVVTAKVTCGELLDDLLEYTEANIKPTTARVWQLVIEATLRPFFGHLRAAKLTTEKLREFRRKRSAEGRSDATANRELSILRTALNRGRKCTPPDRSLGPDHSGRARDGWTACNFRRIRKGNTAGTNSGWPGSCAGEWEATGAAGDRGRPRRRNPETTSGWSQQV